MQRPKNNTYSDWSHHHKHMNDQSKIITTYHHIAYTSYREQKK